MTKDHRGALKEVRSFPSLVRYLRDELDWPITTDDFEELTFDYTPEELGIDAKNAAKIQEIKRLRPLVTKQPWGIFFVKFEPKRLPVVALRRILSQVVLKKRASANKSDRAAWQADDLLFVSNFGEGDARQISFAHFSQDPTKTDLPTLRVLGWDNLDTPLHVNHVADMLSEHLSWPADEDNTEVWRETWRHAFTLRHRQVITTAKALAERLAELARAIRDRIRTVIDVESDRGPVTTLMNAFQEALVHDLDADGFADMYAQTIAYGLLSARVTNPNANTADGFATQLPVTNPFLKELMETFLQVGGRKGNSRSPGIDFDELGVSEVVEVLDDANMEAVLRDFGDKNPQEDPVIHFYERFLKEYDAKKRMQRGVFYTPRPVVSYIVRSVHELLRTEFGLVEGLADTATWGEMVQRVKGLQIPDRVEANDPFVVVLDPATGTGTFLVEAIDLIHRTLVEKWMLAGNDETSIRELWNEYVPNHLLPRLHGYELLMAPYAIAHLKIGLKLHETGYAFKSQEQRARVFLTNALEPAHDFSGQFEFAIPALAHEAEAVNHVKRQQRFTVVLGNPPYSKLSGNLGPSAVALVEPFRSVDGERIVEKGALALELNLQDDYVKFWGLLCRQMQESAVGVASYITNSRYLASPTLRGLRAYLRNNFTKGFFLDLGGQVSERKSVGSVDENVFEIEQGVSIGAVVAKPQGPPIEVTLYERMTGRREDKHAQLASSMITSLPTSITVTPPLYRFARSSDDSDQEFDSWPRLDEIMPFNSGSIITSRDNLAIDFDRKMLLRKIEQFASSKRGDHSLEEEIGYSVKSKWDVERAKEHIRSVEPRSKAVRRILYRPFDGRYIYYVPALLDTPSKPVCASIFGHENLVLLTPGVKTGNDFTHVLVSRDPAEKKAASHDRATQMFPLYRYEGPGSMLEGKTINVDQRVFSNSDECAAFNYIYAILHSPTYRRKYGSALRDSYPRVPPPPKGPLFTKLAQLGKDLVALHLLEAPGQVAVSARFDKTTREWRFEIAKGQRVPIEITFTGPPDPRVTRAGWSNNAIWIDATKPRGTGGTEKGTIGFQGVPQAVWTFEIGGYQVCEKWLKDRKGRALTSEEIAHYYRVVIAIDETMRLMREVDDVIDASGGWPGAFPGPTGTTGSSIEIPRKVAEPSVPYQVAPVRETTPKKIREPHAKKKR